MNKQNSRYSAPSFLLLNSLILVIMVMKISIFAQDEKKLPMPSLDGVEVTGVRNIQTNESAAGINDRIEIKVKNLKQLIQRSKCKDENNQQFQNCTPQEIALFLEGREIKGLRPDGGAPQIAPGGDEGTLQFNLARNKDEDPQKDNDKAWADLLGAPKFGASRFWERPNTALSVGLQNGYPLPTNFPFQLIRIRFWWFIICTAVLLLILGLLWWFAKKTELLRDAGPMPFAEPLTTPPTKQTPTIRNLLNLYFFKFIPYQTYEIHKPYSLARFQMAFWLSLVIISFLYIFLVNGAYDTITASVLALIGIGAGTALGAAIIDAGKDNSNTTELDTLRGEEAALNTNIKTLNETLNSATPPDDATKAQLMSEIAAKESQLKAVRSRIKEIEEIQAPQKSQGFLMDILTDESNGISFHRFQMFAWTLILGILFVYQVWYRLSMPEFDPTLIALLGISSGTYLGFKMPEKQ